jgi:UDP-N-acetylglucosamine 2-epimerase (non-hydrolysing)
MTMSPESRIKLLCVVGARPNFMKIAPLMRAFGARADRFSALLVHTGQHYDEAMKDAFFRELNIPEPDVDLGVGSGSHAVQTAEIMRRFEPVLERERPDAVLVVGDVNSTIACALVAAKLLVPVIHVEAGLRSFDRAMPEEINRMLTDRLSDLLFTTEPEGAANLAAEGVDGAQVHFVGNVMIDTLMANLERAVPAAATLAELGGKLALEPERFGVLTLHRPSNVDDPTNLRPLITTLADLSARLPIVFPVHPRTRARIEAAGLWPLIEATAIVPTAPLRYLQLLGLMREARLVLTDSGGIQEEATALGVPCITLRENTERPITVTEGTNTVVGADAGKIRAAFDDVLATGGKAGRVPALWDGRAAERIAEVIETWARGRRAAAA